MDNFDGEFGRWKFRGLEYRVGESIINMLG